MRGEVYNQLITERRRAGGWLGVGLDNLIRRTNEGARRRTNRRHPCEAGLAEFAGCAWAASASATSFCNGTASRPRMRWNARSTLPAVRRGRQGRDDCAPRRRSAKAHDHDRAASGRRERAEVVCAWFSAIVERRRPCRSLRSHLAASRLRPRPAGLGSVVGQAQHQPAVVEVDFHRRLRSRNRQRQSAMILVCAAAESACRA